MASLNFMVYGRAPIDVPVLSIYMQLCYFSDRPVCHIKKSKSLTPMLKVTPPAGDSCESSPIENVPRSKSEPDASLSSPGMLVIVIGSFPRVLVSLELQNWVIFLLFLSKIKRDLDSSN